MVKKISNIQKKNDTLKDKITDLYLDANNKGLVNVPSTIALSNKIKNARTTTLEKILEQGTKLIKDNKPLTWAGIQKLDKNKKSFDNDNDKYEPIIKNTKGNIFKKNYDDEYIIKNNKGNIFKKKENKFIKEQTSKVHRNVSCQIGVYVEVWTIDGKVFTHVRQFETINLNRDIIKYFGSDIRIENRTTPFEEFMTILYAYEPDAYKAIKQIFESVDGYIIIEDVFNTRTYRQGTVLNFNTTFVRRENAKKINYHYIKYDSNPINGDLKNMFNKSLTKYVQDNYQPDSCMFNELLNIYKKSFDKMNEIKQISFVLTYESLWGLIYPTKPFIKDVAHETTLEDMIPFFRKFRLCCIALNINYQLVFKYDPAVEGKNINDKITPSTVYLLIHNNHVEVLNKNIKQLEQVKLVDALSEVKTKDLTANDTYNISNMEEEKHYQFCINQEQFTQIIMNLEKNPVEKLNIDYAGDFQQLLTVFVVTLKYYPKIKIVSNSICAFSFSFGDMYITVRRAGFNANNMNIIFNNEQQYILYEKYFKKFYTSLINKNTMSRYHHNFIDTLINYKVYPITGQWHESDTIHEDDMKKKYTGYDIQKCFTHALMEIKYFPVFNEFDTFKRYDGSVIKDLSFYVVEHRFSSVDDADFLILSKQYTVIPGYIINKRKMDIDILYYAEPSKIVKNDISNLIEDMYKSKLDLSHKKNLVNIIIGMLAKQKNTVVNTVYSDTPEETMTIGKNKSHIQAFKLGEEVLYSISNKAEKELIEGFLPISIMIHAIACMHMAELYEKIINSGGNPLCIKTDCIVVEKPCLELQEIKVSDKELSEFEGGIEHAIKFKNIGQIRLEKDKPIYGAQMKLINNGLLFNDRHQLIIFQDNPKPNRINIQDEFNTEEINKVLKNNNKLIVRACVPGAGKTTIFKKYINSGVKGLFVTPYNNLACELIKEGYNATTLYSLVGILLTEKLSEEKGKAYDVSDIEIIIFDEIYCQSTNDLGKIKRYMESNQDIKYYATGDSKQLPPIETLNITEPYEYYETIMNMLFPNCIELKKSKRLKNANEQLILEQVKSDIFGGQMKMVDIAKKYFKVIHNLEEMRGYGIAYLNDTVDTINTWKHSTIKNNKPIKVMINGTLYYNGLELVCKNRLRLNNKQKMHKNYTYTILKVSKEEFILTDYTNEKFIINTKLLYRFTLNYCRTGHSVQGVTVQGDITIFDIEYLMTSPRWFYTALTRATGLDNIYIFIDKNEELKNRITMDLFKKNCMNKIKNYEASDISKGFKFDMKDYVNYEWIKKKMFDCEGTCYRCNTTLQYSKIKNEKQQFSVNRLDNTKPHLMNNCEIICLLCNNALK